MIELSANRFDRRLDVAVVDEMVLPGWDVAFDNDINLEGMAMHAPAFVPLRK